MFTNQYEMQKATQTIVLNSNNTTWITLINGTKMDSGLSDLQTAHNYYIFIEWATLQYNKELPQVYKPQG